MRTIGLIGGMSWESTQTYYQLINQGIKNKLGGLHSAKIILNSIDFAKIEHCQRNQHWQEATEILLQAALNVQAAKADCLLICTNTMHKVAPQIEAAIDIPLLHIADATGKALQQAKVKTVGLLGTKFTMTEDFYTQRLAEKFDLNVLTPPSGAQERVHEVIYNELCLGIINNKSKAAYIDIIHQLAEQGAQSVILGCTEIGLLINQADSPLPLFDTTQIHAQQAVEFALA